MLSKQQKKDLVIELANEIKAAKAGVFCDFSGLPAREIQKLRQTLGKEGVSYQVVKINLLKKALRLAGYDTAGLDFNKPTAVALSAEDEVAAARILNAFAGKEEKIKIISGILDKGVIGASQVKALALLPDRQTLRGQLVGVVAAPLRGLVSVLAGNIRGLINVLNAKSKLT